ncbi:MAG: prepilin-type N-terminal cleavage/methylation domain-containing protein, partial [Actinomycetota bacterium]
MLDMLQKRRDDEEGFTLIELMVVVLIIAILLAIAIPTFLGARDRANNRAAQSSARNSLTAAKVLFTDDQDYLTATPGNLDVEEPSLDHVDGATASTDFKMVSVASDARGTEFGAAVLSKSGDCFLINDASGAGGGTTYAKQEPATACDGNTALLAADAEW